jgi:hypothetical protein
VGWNMIHNSLELDITDKIDNKPSLTTTTIPHNRYTNIIDFSIIFRFYQ